MNFTEPSKTQRFTWQDECNMVKAAIAHFPEQFHLTSNKIGTFRLSESASYVSNGNVILYTEILRDGKWQSYAKGTIAELLDTIIPMEIA